MGARSAAFNIIFGAKTDQLQKALKTVDGQLGKAQKRFNSVGSAMSRGVTAPLALIGATSFKVAADFEASMSKVKAVSGATGAEFKALEKDAKRLGSSTRFSASEVSGLQLEYAKLGFSSGEIVKVTESTLALAQASGSDLASSAEIAGATLRGFGLNASETGHVTDVMAQAFSTTALDLNSFGEAMKFVAPVAASAGVSIEQATAMIGQLANNGVKGSQAGTALRRILSDMAGDGSSFEEAFKRSAESVVTLGDAKDEVGRSAQSAFLILQKGMKDVENMTGALQESDGAAKGMAATMGDNTTGALANMSSAIEGAQIVIGDALAPVMLKIIGHITDAASAFSKMSSGTQQFIIGLAGAAAAIGPLSSSIGSLIGVGRKILPVISKLNAALMANPYALAAAAVIALGAAIYGAYKRSKQLTGAAKAEADLRSQSMEATIEERAELNKLVAIAKSDEISREARAEAIKKLNKLSPELLGNLTLENIATEEGTAALKAYNKQLIARARASALQEQLVEIEKELLENQQKQAAQNEKIATGASSYVKRRAKSDLKKVLQDENEILERREYLLAELTKSAEEEAKRKPQSDPDEEDTPDPTPTPESASEGSETTVTAKVKVEPDYELTEEDPISAIFDDIATAELDASAAFALTGDESAQAEALADAYMEAAQSAAVLGEMDLAKSLYEQGAASQALVESLEQQAEKQEEAVAATDAQQEVLNELQQKLQQATAQGAVFGDSFDVASAKMDAIRNAINALIAMGLDPASEAIIKLKNELDKLANANTEDTGALGSLFNMKEAGQMLGTNLSNAFNQIRDANADLTAQVEEGAMTQAEAQQRSAEQTKAAIKSAVLGTIGAMLAEATATAIKNAFQSAAATGPAAAFVGPALATAAAGGVAALFASKVPKLAEGGITTKEQLAVVGDNPSGQEAIVPLEKLDGIVANAMTMAGQGDNMAKLEAMERDLQAQLHSTDLSQKERRAIKRDLRDIDALKFGQEAQSSGRFLDNLFAGMNRIQTGQHLNQDKAVNNLSARIEGQDILLSQERTARGRRRVRNY